jgi:predicted naringenin-chalcone synthase
MITAIRSLATASPARYFTGAQAYQFFTTHFDLAGDERELYRRLLLEGPIRGRYLAVEHEEQFCQMSADQQLDRFRTFAIALGTAAARDALSGAGLGPSELGGLVVNTCTGYLCPGLSSYLAESLNLPSAVKAIDLMGMGCGAAIPNMQSGAGMLALTSDNGGCKTVLCVSVEICSATMFMGADAGLTVSNCLFGDGAAAAVLAGRPTGDNGEVRLLDFECGVFPEHREALRYRHEQGRLRNVLTRRVPMIGARTIRQVAQRLLERHGLTTTQIDRWVVHPGGTAVLEEVEKELSLPTESLRFSYEILQDYGNMSSPSVLFVLKRMLEQDRPQRGQRGLMLSFGAGFSAYAALIEF